MTGCHFGKSGWYEIKIRLSWESCQVSLAELSILDNPHSSFSQADSPVRRLMPLTGVVMQFVMLFIIGIRSRQPGSGSLQFK